MKVKIKHGLLQDRILRRIRAKGASWAFTPTDFVDLGDARSIGMVLTRLSRKGTIRRVRRGFYEIPHRHPLLGTVGASPDAITDAIARRDALKLLPSGAHAANALGLSTQVAARAAYGVAGRSRMEPTIGKSTVTFRRRSTKTMALAGRISGSIAEALRSIGRAHIISERLQVLKQQLNDAQRRQLRADIRYVPAWMRPHFLELSANA